MDPVLHQKLQVSSPPIRKENCVKIYTTKFHNKWKDRGIENLTANAMSLSSIMATVRSKGVACPKCLIPVRNQAEINLIH